MEKQAETAKRFLSLDSAESFTLDVLVAQLTANKEKLTKAEEDLRNIQQELAAFYYSKRDELEVENQTLKAKRHELNQTLSDDQASC